MWPCVCSYHVLTIVVSNNIHWHTTLWNQRWSPGHSSQTPHAVRRRGTFARRQMLPILSSKFRVLWYASPQVIWEGTTVKDLFNKYLPGNCHHQCKQWHVFHFQEPVHSPAMHQLTILLTHTASETHSCTRHSLNSQTPRLLTVKDSATSILTEWVFSYFSVDILELEDILLIWVHTYVFVHISAFICKLWFFDVGAQCTSSGLYTLMHVLQKLPELQLLHLAATEFINVGLWGFVCMCCNFSCLHSESGVPDTGIAIFGIGQLGYRNMNRN